LLFPLFSILVACYHYLYHHHGSHRCCSLFLVFWWHVIITCIIFMDVIFVVPSFKYFGGTLSLLVSSSWESSLLFPLFSILVARYHYLYHLHGRHRCFSLFLVFWWHVIITCIIIVGVIIVVPSF
jgi:hypothetical protein